MEPVLALHGLEQTGEVWRAVRAAAPDQWLITPDLRGRGEVAHLGGPYGIDQHVTDVVDLLDEHGLEQVHVLGLSLGGFIGVALADRHPDRVRSLVLVDGGPPMVVPPGLTAENLPQVYATRSEAVVADAMDVFFRDHPLDRVLTTHPVCFLRAQWGIGPDVPPAYGDERVAQLRAGGLDVTEVDGVDHDGIVTTATGARAVAQALRSATMSPWPISSGRRTAPPR